MAFAVFRESSASDMSPSCRGSIDGTISTYSVRIQITWLSLCFVRAVRLKCHPPAGMKQVDAGAEIRDVSAGRLAEMPYGERQRRRRARTAQRMAAALQAGAAQAGASRQAAAPAAGALPADLGCSGGGGSGPLLPQALQHQAGDALRRLPRLRARWAAAAAGPGSGCISRSTPSVAF